MAYTTELKVEYESALSIGSASTDHIPSETFTQFSTEADDRLNELTTISAADIARAATFFVTAKCFRYLMNKALRNRTLKLKTFEMYTDMGSLVEHLKSNYDYYLNEYNAIVGTKSELTAAPLVVFSDTEMILE